VSDDRPPADEDGREEVGTVAEETAKLLSAFQDWARESGGEQAQAAAAAASGIGASVRGIGEHLGHGPDCRYCPVCQVINAVRETSPEVKQNLAIAASSLLKAVQGMLATQVPDERTRRQTQVQKIDLDETD
jgi:hypothetical protein